MAFDQIASDHSSVAGVKPLWNAVLALELGEMFADQNLLFDLEAAFFQVNHPAVAAVSGRRFVDGHRWRRRFYLCVNETGR